jgi:hypothetical protein
LSPVFDLSACSNAWLRYYRWYTNDTAGTPSADAWAVDASADGGATWVRIETTGMSERRWVLVEHDLARHISLSSQARIRFVASDEDPGGIVEAAIDDLTLVTYRSTITAVLPDPSRAARAPTLEQNFPNPFNPTTNIRFAVPQTSDVSIKIYNMLGQEVRDLFSGVMERGVKIVEWNGKDNNGNLMPSGSYLYRMSAAGFVKSNKMVLLK